MSRFYLPDDLTGDLFAAFQDQPVSSNPPTAPKMAAQPQEGGQTVNGVHQGYGNGSGKSSANGSGQGNGQAGRNGRPPFTTTANVQTNQSSSQNAAQTAVLDQLMGLAPSPVNGIAGDRATAPSLDPAQNPVGAQQFLASISTIKSELEKAGMLNQPELRENLQQLIRLYKNAYSELDKQVELGVQKRLEALKYQGTAIVQEMKHAPKPETLFQIVVTSLQVALKGDRVMLLRFANEAQVTVLAEIAGYGSPSLQEKSLPAGCFGRNQREEYRGAAMLRVEDLYETQLPTYQRHFLERLQMRASLTLPLVVGGEVWGLLAVLHSGEARQWQEMEASLLLQVGSELCLQLQNARSQAQISKLVERERTISRVFGKLRQANDLATIFSTVTQEMRKLLGVERLTIYKFREDFFGDFIAEAVTGDYPKLVGSGWEDPYLHEHKGGRFRDNIPLVVDDIYTGETFWEDGQFSLKAAKRPLTDCHIEALEYYQVRACVVVAVFQGDKLWGLLSAFQNTGARRWEEDEVRLMMQIANQLGLVIPQVIYTTQLEKAAERDRAAARVINKLRQSLDIETIFNTVTHEMRRLLNVERLTIYKFRDDYFGDFVAESIAGDYPKLVGSGWEDSYLHEHKGGRFRDNIPLIVDNIHTGETLWENGKFSTKPKRLLTDCHIEALEYYQVKACVVVAIFQGDKLWGLLSAFQNTGVRQWEEDEVRLMMQMATQVGIAMQQAEYTVYLAKTADRERALSRVFNQMRRSLDLKSIFSTVTHEARRLLNVERLTIYKFRDDYFGDFVAESIAGDYPKLVGSGWEDPYLNEHKGGRFCDNIPLIVNDIYTGETIWENGQSSLTKPRRLLTGCHVEALEYYQVKACVVVAIFQGDKLWGLLSAFQNTGARQWEDDEVRLMMQIADQLGVVIQQSEYAGQLAKVAQREQTLNRVLTKIRQSSNLSNVFAIATQELRQALSCDRVCVYQFAEDWSGQFVAESVGADWVSVMQMQSESDVLEGNYLADDRCTVQELDASAVTDADTYMQQTKGGSYARGNSYKQVNDIYKMNYARCYLDTLEKYQCRSYIIVPIFQDNKLWGLFAAYQNSGPRQWQEAEVKTMLQLSSSLGVAISQSEYLNRIQEQNRRAARETEIERTLAKVVDKIRKSLSIDTIFDTATQETRKLLGVERVAVYKFRPDYYGDILAESKTGDYPSLIGAAWEDPYLQEHQGGRFRNNEVMVADDVYAAGMTDCHVEALEFFGFRACAVVAIFKGQQLWGLLSAFQHSGPRHWEEGEVRLLNQIAAQLGFALQQSEYVEQLQTQAQQGAMAIAREKESRETLQRNVLQLLMAVRPALDGDLTVRAPLTEDEVGTVADAYNNTLQSLRRLVIQVQTAATQVGQTSQQSGGAIAGLSQQAQREAEDITHALQQIQAMLDSTKAVATNAQQVNTAVQQANQIVQQGDLAMNRTVDGILGIRETVSETSKKIKRLSESTQKISKVVNLISTFTSQTQLLALNAAIEATRAGEAGRGFAVVADEVRALARQSAEATTEIEKLVQEIQIETSAVATAMDAGIEQVVSGTNLVNTTRQSLNEIVSATAQISQLVGAITQAAQNQTQQSETVTATMTDVAAIAQQTSQEAIRISASFQELLQTAEALQSSIGQFKVS